MRGGGSLPACLLSPAGRAAGRGGCLASTRGGARWERHQPWPAGAVGADGGLAVGAARLPPTVASPMRAATGGAVVGQLCVCRTMGGGWTRRGNCLGVRGESLWLSMAGSARGGSTVGAHCRQWGRADRRHWRRQKEGKKTISPYSQTHPTHKAAATTGAAAPMAGRVRAPASRQPPATAQAAAGRIGSLLRKGSARTASCRPLPPPPPLHAPSRPRP